MEFNSPNSIIQAQGQARSESQEPRKEPERVEVEITDNESVSLTASKEPRKLAHEFANTNLRKPHYIKQNRSNITGEVRPTNVEVQVNVSVNGQPVHGFNKHLATNQHTVFDDLITADAQKIAADNAKPKLRRARKKNSSNGLSESALEEASDTQSIEAAHDNDEVLQDQHRLEEKLQEDELKVLIDRAEKFATSDLDSVKDFNAIRFISHIVFLPIGLILNCIESSADKRLGAFQGFFKSEQTKQEKIYSSKKEYFVNSLKEESSLKALLTAGDSIENISTKLKDKHNGLREKIKTLQASGLHNVDELAKLALEISLVQQQGQLLDRYKARLAKLNGDAEKLARLKQRVVEEDLRFITRGSAQLFNRSARLLLLTKLQLRDKKLYTKVDKLIKQKMGSEAVKHAFSKLWETVKQKAHDTKEFFVHRVIGRDLAKQITNEATDLTKKLGEGVKDLVVGSLESGNVDEKQLEKKLSSSLDTMKNSLGSIRERAGDVFSKVIDKVASSAAQGIDDLKKNSPDLVGVMSKTLSDSSVRHGLNELKKELQSK